MRRAREDDRARGDDRAVAELAPAAASSRFAVERGDSVGCLPTTASSSTLHALAEHRARVDDRGRDGSSAIERRLESVSSVRTTASAVLRDLARGRRSPSHQLEERLALEPQRLVVRDLRAEDVAGARQPLAVALGADSGAFS